MPTSKDLRQRARQQRQRRMARRVCGAFAAGRKRCLIGPGSGFPYAESVWTG